MTQDNSAEKLHSACDECRTRKLKCTREIPECARCQREGTRCVYSPQKPMGRPRKRRREDQKDSYLGPASTDQLDEDTNLHGVSAVENALNFGLVSSFDLGNLYDVNDDVLDIPAPEAGTIADQNHILSESNHSFTHNSHTDSKTCDLIMNNPSQPSEQIALPSPQPLAPCSCLSLMYLHLIELQTMTSFAFPQVIVPLRKAMTTLNDLIHCPQCPQEAFSAMQNVQSIVALCKAIIERFQQVLLKIDHEAKKLSEGGQKKPVRMGDNSPAIANLHTGTPDCPMGFVVDLEPQDWKRFVKGALKTEIWGGGSNPKPLMELIREVEKRQERWHEDTSCLSDEQRLLFASGPPYGHIKHCEALNSTRIKRGIDNLKWD